jgi:hypothetical protein
MLGCMVSHLTQCKETSPDTPDRPMVQRAIWSKEVLPPSRRTRPDRYPHPSPFDHRTSILGPHRRQDHPQHVCRSCFCGCRCLSLRMCPSQSPRYSHGQLQRCPKCGIRSRCCHSIWSGKVSICCDVGENAYYFSRTDILCWLLPIVLQFILPIAIILCSPILPESPRWLAGQGRLEEAAAVIRSLRKRTPENSDEAIWAEVQEIQAAYMEMRQLHSGTGWAELFRGANLRRTLVAIGLQSLQQAQGVSFVSNYTVTTFLSLGINNVFTIVLILYVVLLVSSLGAFYLPDKVGRRTCKPGFTLTQMSQTDCQCFLSVPLRVPFGWLSLAQSLPHSPSLPATMPTS